MAEDRVPDSEDTRDNAAPAIEDGGTPPDSSDTGDGKLLAGKYRNAEELERGYKESEKAMQAAAQEAARLRSENERIQSQILERLAAREARETMPRDATREELEAKRKEIEERMDKEGASAIFDVIRDSYSEEGNIRARELKTRDERIERLEAQIQELRETSDPLYQERRDEINRVMKEAGISRQQAMKAVGILAPKAAVSEDSAGRAVPAGISSGRVPSRGTDNESAEVTKEEEQAWLNMGIRPDVIAEMKKEYSRRNRK